MSTWLFLTHCILHVLPRMHARHAAAFYWLFTDHSTHTLPSERVAGPPLSRFTQWVTAFYPTPCLVQFALLPRSPTYLPYCSCLQRYCCLFLPTPLCRCTLLPFGLFYSYSTPLYTHYVTFFTYFRCHARVTAGAVRAPPGLMDGSFTAHAPLLTPRSFTRLPRTYNVRAPPHLPDVPGRAPLPAGHLPHYTLHRTLPPRCRTFTDCAPLRAVLLHVTGHYTQARWLHTVYAPPRCPALPPSARTSHRCCCACYTRSHCCCHCFCLPLFLHPFLTLPPHTFPTPFAYYFVIRLFTFYILPCILKNFSFLVGLRTHILRCTLHLPQHYLPIRYLIYSSTFWDTVDSMRVTRLPFFVLVNVPVAGMPGFVPHTGCYLEKEEERRQLPTHYQLPEPRKKEGERKRLHSRSHHAPTRYVHYRLTRVHLCLTFPSHPTAYTALV